MAVGVVLRTAMARGQWRWPALAMFAVGYGANQFVPLLAVYRRTLALSDVDATAIFGVYALGLIPALLLSGRASDRYGRRRLLLAFTGLSVLASAVLITAQWGAAGLYAGRLLTGVASGVVFTVGTAWIKELSEGTSPGTGARRSALALTAGFGIGPLVAGPLAQWATAPEVLPYLVHIALAGIALALLSRVHEARPPRAALQQRRKPLLPSAATSIRFRGVVAPMAVWVFGSVTLVFTTLPAHAAGPLPALGVAFPGLLAAGALAAGLASQRWGQRLHDTTAVHSDGRAAAVGLAVVTAGYLAAATATAHPSALGATAAALLLGAGYGICLIVGLRETEQLATPGELGALVALYYSFSYFGLAVPYLIALVAPHVGFPQAVLLAAAATTLTLLVVLVQGRRSAPERPPAPPMTNR